VKSDAKYPIVVFLMLYFALVLLFVLFFARSEEKLADAAKPAMMSAEQTVIIDKNDGDKLIDILAKPIYETDTFRMEYYPALKIGKKSENGRFYLISFKEKQMHSGAFLDQVRGLNVMLATSVNTDPAAAKAYTVMHFEPGQYVVDDIEARYYDQMNRFATNVLKLLNKKNSCDYALYVRGMADEPHFDGIQRDDYSYNSIKYFPRLNGHDYSDMYAAFPHTVGKQYTNDDLPFLRGAFLREVFHKEYKKYLTFPPTTLQGWVTGNQDIMDRKAELFLYINDKCDPKNHE